LNHFFSNLIFPIPDDRLESPPIEVANVADIDTGRVYRNAYNSLCNLPQPHPLWNYLIYIDELAMDWHGQLSLEPVILLIHIQQKRNQPDAQQPLGYIPNIGLMLNVESTHAMKSLAKVQLYHDILSQIFGSLVELQSKEGGLPHQFNYYCGKVYNVLL
jgi:hypothetical protein